MRRLTQAARQRDEAGEPLPVVFPTLAKMDASFRRAQSHLVAGAPGAGKSVLARTLAVRAQVPALYFSPDGDEYTVLTSIASMVSGDSISLITARCPGPVDVLTEYPQVYDSDSYLRFDFTPAPSISDIRDEVAAFEESWGEFPQLIVIDSLRNIFSEADEYTAMRQSMESLTILARETGACVVALHHLTGAWETDAGPPPLGAIEGKVSKFPSLVLTLYRGAYSDVGVAVVKNRFGPADFAGKHHAFFETDLSRARLI